VLVGVEDNNNINMDKNIEENNLSDEEDSVPDVLYEKESDSGEESDNEEETFVPGVEDDQSMSSKDPTQDGSHSRVIVQIRKSPCAENHIESNFSWPAK